MPSGLAMSREEREAFLAGVHVGVVSIDEPGRAPLSAPVWYDFTPERGVWFITVRTSRKGIALERAGRYSLVAQQGEMPYRYVSVEGRIVEMREADLEKDRRPMAHRYFGREFGDAYVDGGGSEEGVNFLYRVQPERWLTVDYSKLGLG